MRNLVTTRRRNVCAQSLEVPDLTLAATAWDPASNSIICAFGPSLELPMVEVGRLQDGMVDTIISWNHQTSSLEEGSASDQILDMHAFEDSSISLVFRGGDVVVISGIDSNDATVEIVGSVDEGILAASWSPDEELLILATGHDTVIIMTRQFEIVCNRKLNLEDLSLSKHVDVGWGKKETQFKGKRAAALRDPTMPERVDTGALSALDSRLVQLSWRGDGQYFVSSTIHEGRRRILRVFARNGELDGVSEPVDGMEGALAWRPSGNLIASVKRSTDGIHVIFFERNGLRHGEFPLRVRGPDLDHTQVLEIKWNVDSTVLAVRLSDRIQLWSSGNYHWYLKWELMNECMGIENKSTIDCTKAWMRWHPEKALQLHFVSKDTILEFDYAWKIHRGPTYPPFDYGVVAVIDGNRLKITPLRFANVPPPMALYEIELPGTVVDISFSSTDLSFAALTHESVHLIKWKTRVSPGITPASIQKDIIRLEKTSWYRQIRILGESRIALLHDWVNSTSEISFYELQDSVWNKKTEPDSLISPTGFSYIEASKDECSLLCGGNTGKLAILNKDGKSDIEIAPQACLFEESYNLESNSRIVVGLSSNGRLFINESHLASGCTSFVVTETHVILTTSQNYLKFVSLQQVESEFQLPPDDATADERCRSIERGAKLITVIPSTFAVVLQMPRGNLETIYPRALILSGIRNHINSKDYRAAFELSRTHRVDLNLLYDHNPDQFLTSVDFFLSQVNNIQYIDLFLSQLRDDDVSRTMYNPSVWTSAPQTNGEVALSANTTVAGKVNKICDAMLEGLRKLPKASTQNIVSCYVNRKPPDLGSGLRMISNLRETNSDDADVAIEHICFLADVNDLYDHALGIYDLELTLLIAQQSQKDPREYLPFLQKIREMIPIRQKFFINDHLGRFSEAAVALNDAGDDSFTELTDYMVRHDLYRVVTNLVKYDGYKQRIVLKLHAEYLLLTAKYNEAGLAFECLNDWGRALEAYQKCGYWKEALFSASMIPLSKQEITELSTVLVESLLESKDYYNAARVYLDYLDDVKEAIVAYCKGYHFGEAMRISLLKQQENLLKDVVDQSLIEAFNTISELITDFRSQLKAQILRIKELKEKKEQDPLAFYGTGTESDMPDNVSVAGTTVSATTGSIFTRYTDKSNGTLGTSATRRTSKNRRREERKKARGKKGSVYEEEYLINSVSRLIGRFNETQADSHKLIEGLFRRGMREQAESIQAGMEEVSKRLLEAKDEVFKEPYSGGSTAGNDTGFDVKALGEADLTGLKTAIRRPDFSQLEAFRSFELLL